MDPEPEDRPPGICICNRDDGSFGRRRRLIVAFDGTQNQFGPESSHVVEFYSRIVKSEDQISYYTSGIGTFVKPSSFGSRTRMWIKNKREAMVGSNFTSNILSGYRFLSENYETGDQIFLLGFSRGAYQTRVLAAMITKVGLLCTGNNEQIPFAFEIYMDPKTSDQRPKDSDRPERGMSTDANEFREAFCRSANIHFVGVWDTVSSVGQQYPGAELAENMCFFRHALALDERRVKFLPEYVVAKKEWFSAREHCRPICKEVWFRGSHSDVGGGNKKNISCDGGAIPSRWMAYEAMLAGLEMKPFWNGIQVEDVAPNEVFKDSMTRFYTLLEYTNFTWEDHSEDRPLFLTVVGDKVELPLRKTSSAWHRKRPRQIYSHQKLHASVCLHKQELPEEPFARLPKSWINQPGETGWAQVINRLRIEEENMKDATRASRSGWVVLPGSGSPPRSPPLSMVSSFGRGVVRDTIRRASTSLPGSRPSSINLQWRFPDSDHQSHINSESAHGGHVNDDPIAAEAITTASPPTNVPILPAEFTLPPEAIELDLLDCNGIPTLISGVLNGTNVNEFLERLEALAYTDDGKISIQEENEGQFSLMVQKVFDEGEFEYKFKYAKLAIKIAYDAFGHSEVDLYAADIELWKAILSRVENWNRLETDLALSSAFPKAVRLLHHTESRRALIEIKAAINRMLDYRLQTPDERQHSAQTLLGTIAEWKSQGLILRLAVSSSPYFSKSEFTETLVNCLTGMILNSTGERTTMLCLCVLCAIDERVSLSEDLFNSLNLKIERMAPLLCQMWRLVGINTVLGMTGGLKTLLRAVLLQPEFARAFRRSYRRWALGVLDQALRHRTTRWPKTSRRPADESEEDVVLDTPEEGVVLNNDAGSPGRADLPKVEELPLPSTVRFFDEP